MERWALLSFGTHRLHPRRDAPVRVNRSDQAVRNTVNSLQTTQQRGPRGSGCAVISDEDGGVNRGGASAFDFDGSGSDDPLDRTGDNLLFPDR